jgi:hypothetical protein
MIVEDQRRRSDGRCSEQITPADRGASAPHLRDGTMLQLLDRNPEVRRWSMAVSFPGCVAEIHRHTRFVT